MAEVAVELPAKVIRHVPDFFGDNPTTTVDVEMPLIVQTFGAA